MRVAITGAGGRLGRETLNALEDEDITALTHHEHEDIDSIVASVSDRETLKRAFENADVVIHLAADSNGSAPWESVLKTNIDGTQTVYEAAIGANVRRVVFASSNHTTGMYNIDSSKTRGTIRDEAVTVVSPEDPVRPDGFYGVSKVTGEALGRYYADRYGLEVLNLRIGWYLSREELRAELAAEPEHERFARALWLSPEDCQQIMRRSARCSLPENPLTIHAISDNSSRYLTLAGAIQSIGYQPQSDSANIDP